MSTTAFTFKNLSRHYAKWGLFRALWNFAKVHWQLYHLPNEHCVAISVYCLYSTKHVQILVIVSSLFLLASICMLILSTIPEFQESWKVQNISAVSKNMQMRYIIKHNLGSIELFLIIQLLLQNFLNIHNKQTCKQCMTALARAFTLNLSLFSATYSSKTLS